MTMFLIELVVVVLSFLISYLIHRYGKEAFISLKSLPQQ